MAVAAPVHHQFQFGFERGQTADALLDVGQTGLGDAVGRRARLARIVLQRQQGADRVDLEPKFEIGGLAALDYLGYGLPSNLPSLGELALQGKSNLQAPWLGFSAFFTFAIMLSLLVFIFEGVRDAFDPRKTFR